MCVRACVCECVRVFVCALACARARACVRARARACARACVCVRAHVCVCERVCVCVCVLWIIFRWTPPAYPAVERQHTATGSKGIAVVWFMAMRSRTCGS